MKRFVELAWLKPISADLKNHLRNEMRLKDEHKTIFDSLTARSGTIEFHVDSTGIERNRFARLYNQLAESVLLELIRLAEIGLKEEMKKK